MSGPARNDQGFTLIETLVALVILALALGACWQGLAGGWRGWRHADAETAAVRLAKARLAGTGIEQPLAEGRQAGESDGLGWVVETRRHGTAPGATDAGTRRRQSAPLALFRITAEVTWRDGPLGRTRSLALSTLKLGPRP